MFATIRKYTPKPGSDIKAGMEQLRRQLHDDFLPIVQGIPGFHGYYALNVENRDLVTISVFESREGGTESTRRAAEFVQKNPLPFDVGRPEILEGELLTYAEAAREVGAH
ncbi:MAG: hypothetical protein ACREMX_08800 [Gemmatimonadales bacterium]